MKRSLLVLYTGDDWRREQPNTGTYALVYRIWDEVLRKRNVELTRASVRWFSHGHFTKYWRYRAGGWWDKVERPLVPTVVSDLTRSYDRKTGDPLTYVQTGRQEIGNVTELVNTAEFADLVDNKVNMSVIFHGHMPRSRLVLPGDVLKNPRRRFIVLKRLEGSGGEQVTISRRPRLPIETTMLEQEFVAATVGGVLKDIRIAFTGNKVQYAYYRIAPRGTLYTNVHFGARMEFINLRDIAPLVRHAREVARPLAIFPKKIFCLDFLLDARRRKPLLIESNSMPGMDGFTDAGYHRLLSDVTAHLLG